MIFEKQSFWKNQKTITDKFGNVVNPNIVLDGGHSVEMVGWGTQKDVPYELAKDGSLKIAKVLDYWIIKNSWRCF